MIAAGDHVGLKDLMYAAAAVACGQDMDVPESKLYVTTLLSPSDPVTVVPSDQAARMSTPGAVISGCRFRNQERKLGISTVAKIGLGGCLGSPRPICP